MDTVTRYGKHLTSQGRRPETVRNRTGYLRRARRALGCDVLQADPYDVESWWACHSSAEGRAGARASVVGYVAWAHERRLLPPDQDPGRLLPVVSAPAGLPRPATDGMIRDALAAADPRAYAVIMLSAQAGLRAAEIAGMRWQDVDLDRGAARIEQKGGAVVVAVLNADAVAALRPLSKRSGPVILGRNGAMRPASVSALASRTFADAGHPGVRLHQCRHRCGTEAYRATGDLLATSRLLRHKSVQTTLIYVQLAGDAVRGTADSLPRLTSNDDQDARLAA